MVRKAKQNKAFSLVEILLVIAVVALLFIAIISRADNMNNSAKVSGVKSDFRAMCSV